MSSHARRFQGKPNGTLRPIGTALAVVVAVVLGATVASFARGEPVQTAGAVELETTSAVQAH